MLRALRVCACVCELTGDQPGGHGSTQRAAAVDEDVFMAVRVGGALSALPRPRAFNLRMENLLVTLQRFTQICLRKGLLTSSLVVRLEATR